MTHEVRREGDERYARNRRELADELAGRVPFETPEEAEHLVSGVLTAWVVLAEFEAEDGNRWLTLCSGTGSGSNDLPAWTLRALGTELEEWAQEPSGDDDRDE